MRWWGVSSGVWSALGRCPRGSGAAAGAVCPQPKPPSPGVCVNLPPPTLLEGRGCSSSLRACPPGSHRQTGFWQGSTVRLGAGVTEGKRGPGPTQRPLVTSHHRPGRKKTCPRSAHPREQSPGPALLPACSVPQAALLGGHQLAGGLFLGQASRCSSSSEGEPHFVLFPSSAVHRGGGRRGCRRSPAAPVGS